MSLRPFVATLLLFSSSLVHANELDALGELQLLTDQKIVESRRQFLTPPQLRAMAATVRIRVQAGDLFDIGTGTVIHTDEDEAIIATCAHIFVKDEQSNLTTPAEMPKIVIDRFDKVGAESIDATLISHDIKLDVALVRIQPWESIVAVSLASQDARQKQGNFAFSVGCNRGEAPSVMISSIKEIDKYLGPPNLIASGTPIVGRSGGGLFNRLGELIGVCNAADPEYNEGLYADVQRVYTELERDQLSHIYQDGPPTNQLAGVDDAAKADKSLDAEQVPPTQGTLAKSDQVAKSDQAVKTGPQSELVCIVLGGASNKRRTFVIKNPTETLLDYLEHEAARAAGQDTPKVTSLESGRTKPTSWEVPKDSQ